MATDKRENRITRRDLLRKVGVTALAAGAASLAAACQQPPPAAPTTAPPQPTAAPAKPAATQAPAQPTAAAAAKPTAAPTAVPAVKSGGQATLAIFGAPGGLIAAQTTTTNFGVFTSQSIHEELLAYDSKLQLQPKLAEKWEVSPDGKNYTFYLRKGVKWSDGQPFTARDVEATILSMTHPKVATNNMLFVEDIVGAQERKAGKQEDIPGLKVLDDTTFRITTAEPSGVLVDQIGTELRILPKHILDSIPPDQYMKSPFVNQPNVTTGPFRLVRYVTDQQAELERNPNYWGKRPSLDKVFIKIMTPETAIVQMERGELEVIPGAISGELPPMEAERLKKNPDVTVTAYPNINTETLYANLKTMFGDVRTRQALLYAIDREAIVKQVLLGYGKVAYSAYAELTPYYLADLNKYPYNPGKAKQLLEEAKWDPKQQPNFMLPTGDTTREQVGTIVHQYLQAVGIDAKIERTDFATATNRLIREHRFDLSMSQNRGANNLDLSRRFATRMWTGGVNSGGYSSQELDQLMDQARRTPRFEAQKPLTDKIQRIVNTEVPAILLYFRDSIGAVNTKRLGGAVPLYTGMHRTMADWFLK